MRADIDILSRAALELYSPDLHSGNWIDHAFRFLSVLIPADMVNYGSLDPRAGSLQATTTCDRSDWQDAAFGFATFMRKYSCFNFDPSINGGRPFFRSDHLSDGAFRDLDIYSECFRILRTTDHAAIHVPSEDGCLNWFAVERGGHRNFSEDDRMLLNIAQQHLINTYRLAVARQKICKELPLDPAIFTRAGFSPRQSDVGYWLVAGKTNAEIAMLMNIQTQTVKAHITALFNRTGTGNRLALTLHLLELTRRLQTRPTRLDAFRVPEWAQAGPAPSQPTAPARQAGR